MKCTLHSAQFTVHMPHNIYKVFTSSAPWACGVQLNSALCAVFALWVCTVHCVQCVCTVCAKCANSMQLNSDLCAVCACLPDAVKCTLHTAQWTVHSSLYTVCSKSTSVQLNCALRALCSVCLPSRCTLVKCTLHSSLCSQSTSVQLNCDLCAVCSCLPDALGDRFVGW